MNGFRRSANGNKTYYKAQGNGFPRVLPKVRERAARASLFLQGEGRGSPNVLALRFCVVSVSARLESASWCTLAAGEGAGSSAAAAPALFVLLRLFWRTWSASATVHARESKGSATRRLLPREMRSHCGGTSGRAVAAPALLQKHQPSGNQRQEDKRRGRGDSQEAAEPMKGESAVVAGRRRGVTRCSFTCVRALSSPYST